MSCIGERATFLQFCNFELTGNLFHHQHIECDILLNRIGVANSWLFLYMWPALCQPVICT